MHLWGQECPCDPATASNSVEPSGLLFVFSKRPVYLLLFEIVEWPKSQRTTRACKSSFWHSLALLMLLLSCVSLQPHVANRQGVYPVSSYRTSCMPYKPCESHRLQNIGVRSAYRPVSNATRAAASYCHVR
jgi:hypothetical protein